MKLVVEIEDADRDGIEEVLELILRQVRDGYLSGFDRRDGGRYHYEVTA